MADRTAGLIDAKFGGAEQSGGTSGQSTDASHRLDIPMSIGEYAVECSILRLHGSEMLTLVADELIATGGGYGYVEAVSGRAHGARRAD